jgi:hypothetical protein
MLCHNFLIGKGRTCALRATRVFWEDTTGQPDERRSECRTPTLSLLPSRHCLNSEVYCGHRHHNDCEQVTRHRYQWWPALTEHTQPGDRRGENARDDSLGLLARVLPARELASQCVCVTGSYCTKCFKARVTTWLLVLAS